MSLYAIADLHLGQSVEKPMDKFGVHWKNHDAKIKENWMKSIKPDDLVLIPGDISWAMTLDEAKPDLEFIHDLPGKKILIKGNHDYWWKAVTKMNQLFDDLFFLQNDAYVYEEYGICGSRGWLCPNDTKFTKHDQKIYEREIHRLELSLEQVVKKGCEHIVVMTHYPPTNDRLEPSGFTEIFEKYHVQKVVYGHLHGKDSFEMGLKGNVNGIEYALVSSDYLKFQPIHINKSQF